MTRKARICILQPLLWTWGLRILAFYAGSTSCCFSMTHLHVCRSIVAPGQGCCHLLFMPFCLGPLRFLPHSPPSPGLLGQYALHVQ